MTHAYANAPMVLLASGLGEASGGGLFRLEPSGATTTLDRLSTTGLAVDPEGRSLARLLWTDDDPQTAGELIVHDARGVLRYQRVDALREPHSVMWDGDNLIAVSTLDNAVLWIAPSGEVVRRWIAPGSGPGDCWHLNSLTRRDGRLLVSCFGRFGFHRGWAAAGARDGAGLVVAVDEGAPTVLSGLSAPHDPTPYGDGWLICDSGNHALIHVDGGGGLVDRVDLGGWTRGITISTDSVYVGVSAPRHQGMGGEASVLQLSRSDFTVQTRWTLPCSDVFSLVWAPPALAEGVRSGFGTNRRREAWGEVLGAANSAADPELVSDEAFCARVEVESGPAAATVVGRTVTVDLTVINESPATLRASEDVLIGGRWVAEDGTPAEQARASLGGALVPGARASARLFAAAPDTPGRWRLEIALLQEHVRWFDADDPSRGAVVNVEVGPG